MTTSNSNWIKAYIIDVLPCITIALYILAFVYNQAFYSVFNINITHYLSLSDMLLSIMESMVVLGVVSLLFIGIIILITAINQYNNEERNNKKLTIKAKRIIVKCRNTKIAKRCISIYNKLKDWFVAIYNKLNRRKDNNIIKTEESVKKKKSDTLSFILLSILIIGVCLFVFFDNSNAGVEKKGLLNATLWLLLPLLIVGMFATYDICLTTMSPKNFPKNIFVRNYKPVEVIVAILLFYIYALIVFYTSGLESGKYTMNNDLAKFEIRTSDGIVFTDSTYRYIDIMNDKVFLLEKETDYKVILDKEGLVFLKIAYKDEINNSIIDTFIKKEMWKDKKNRVVKTDSIQ